MAQAEIEWLAVMNSCFDQRSRHYSQRLNIREICRPLRGSDFLHLTQHFAFGYVLGLDYFAPTALAFGGWRATAETQS